MRTECSGSRRARSDRDENGVRRKERMRLEMGHRQDDRAAIWHSQTNPALSAIGSEMRTVDAAFGLALLVVEFQCLEDALASRVASRCSLLSLLRAHMFFRRLDFSLFDDAALGGFGGL